MTEKELKMKFDAELMKTNRNGMGKLVAEMDKGGFYTAPCSTQHHLACPGGLVEHSLNVLDIARKINNALGNPCDEESIIITALLHDLGKMGDHGKSNYVENILKSGVRSDAKPYVSNPELTYLAHEVRSAMIAERFIDLTEEEETAIIWHNGLYSTFKYDIPGKETKLYLILHTADMYASRFVEVE